MSDDDMISKTAALEAVKRETGFDNDHPVVAAIAALPAVTVGVKPLDLSCVQKHAFLSGVVAARNVPPGDPCSGPLLWLDYDPGDHPALARIIAALDLTPAPDAAAIREAALREALREIGNLGAEFQAGGSPTAVKVLNLASDRINALIQKGGA